MPHPDHEPECWQQWFDGGRNVVNAIEPLRVALTVRQGDNRFNLTAEMNWPAWNSLDAGDRRRMFVTALDQLRTHAMRELEFE